MASIKVWDLPTRLFHWLLAAAVVGLVVTGNIGGNAMVWHMRLGFSVFGLLVFRLLWGVVGGHWSRFSVFVPSPTRLWAYLHKRAATSVGLGHNPLGALSVLAMLTVLAAQVATGLVSDDEIAFAGPLSALVSGDTVGAATAYHKGLGKVLLLDLVGLHLAAIAFHQRVRRQPLVQAMVTGEHPTDQPDAGPAALDGPRQRLLALALAVLATALVAWVVSLGA